MNLFHPCALPGLAAVLLVGCASSDPSWTNLRNDYLKRYGSASPRHAAGEEPPPPRIKDDFSFWEDDGTGGTPRIHLDLTAQAAYFYRGEQLVGRSLISSGKEGKETPLGNFKVYYKDADHKSNLYGWILDADGNAINKNADVRKDKPPPGGKFDPSKMTWYLQFAPSIGMHAGHLPGYPASHGCVRMPEWMAEHFFHATPVGTPVKVTR